MGLGDLRKTTRLGLGGVVDTCEGRFKVVVGVRLEMLHFTSDFVVGAGTGSGELKVMLHGCHRFGF